MEPGLAVDPPAASSAFQPKLIYLARRNPALSRRAFVARWRQHGALGMSLPRWRNVARYVHCDVPDLPPPTPGVDSSHDGIGIVWHRSPAARAAHLADTSSRLQMEQDELETFARPIVETCLLARENVLLAPPDPARVPVKLTRFLHAGDGLPALRQAVRDHANMAPRYRELAAADAPVRGHVLNLALPPERGRAWGLACEAVEELWFDDTRAALAAARWFTASPTAPAAITVLTNEVLLYPT